MEALAYQRMHDYALLHVAIKFHMGSLHNKHSYYAHENIKTIDLTRESCYAYICTLSDTLASNRILQNKNLVNLLVLSEDARLLFLRCHPVFFTNIP